MNRIPIIKRFWYHKLPVVLFGLAVFFCVSSFSEKEGIVFSTDYLNIVISLSGNLTAMTERSTGKEYMPEGITTPLLSLYKDSAYIRPNLIRYDEAKNQLLLSYPNKAVARIGIINQGKYLRFELINVLPRNGIEAIVWGPYPTTINESIGETICVVHDARFAIGMQALNLNTIEGTPEGNDNAWGGSFIEPLSGQFLPDSLQDQVGRSVEVNVNLTGDMPAYVRTYRGNAAVKNKLGSELRLFSRDRRIPRKVNNVYGQNGMTRQYVEPIEADFAGSAIAFFGCPEPLVLQIIETIELHEKLPHPLLNGIWIKRSPQVHEPYLMYEGTDMTKAIGWAKNCGFHLIHAGDLFKTWGHFELTTSRFPRGTAGLRSLSDSAANENISFGAHTLTMFTGVDDQYVSPVPSDSLCKVGSTVLTRAAGENDREIYISSPEFLDKLYAIRTVKIGNELITFRGLSADKPWRLLDCKRGQYNTKKAVHNSNSVLDELLNNPYGGFYPDIHLQDKFADRLAAVCNEAHLGLMDFDGMGGESPSGHGSYGVAKFIARWYSELDKYPITCGAGTTHFYWHIYSFMNWGEPWYSALRESQVNARIENQRYFKRNYMAPMLGWFSFGADYRPEEIEWIQARSAGFDAGYLLRVEDNIDNNGFKDAMFESIREWQHARKLGAFNEQQLQKFRDPRNEFHLEKKEEGRWDLYPISLQGGFVHKFRQVQTGEPVTSRFIITNSFAAQPAQLYISIEENGENKTATVTGLTIEINHYADLEINETLKGGDKLVCDGESIYRCDATWNRQQKITATEIPRFEKGTNEILVTSKFSAPKSPVLRFEFKTVGTPEPVQVNNIKP